MQRYLASIEDHYIKFEPSPCGGWVNVVEAEDEIERLQARVEQLKGHLDWVGWSSDGVAEGQAKIEQLREALDVVGWDEWFMRLQIAVRGHKSLINECGERIERARKAAEAKEK